MTAQPRTPGSWLRAARARSSTTSATAFALPLRDPSTGEDRRAFAVGNSFFNDNWVTAPASTDGRDGLGPTFNAQSCSSCHFKDGRAEPPAERRRPRARACSCASACPDPTARRMPVPGVRRPAPGPGDQRRAGRGHDARISYERVAGHASPTARPTRCWRPTYEIVDPAFGPLPPDVLISPRLAPPVFGVGLLEAVPERPCSPHADPDDADGDGISGRPNRVADVRDRRHRLGRFGWKANVPTVEQQTAGAFHGDIGITSSLFPDENCPRGRPRAAPRRTAGRPSSTTRSSTGSPSTPARWRCRPAATSVPPTRRAASSCSPSSAARRATVPSCTTGPMPTSRRSSHQVIRPYTDLLLHDMGPGLADGRPDGEATGQEWRTAPLWGIGLDRDRQRPHPLPARRPGAQPDRGHPLARRRGRGRRRGASGTAGVGARHAHRLPGVALMRRGTRRDWRWPLPWWWRLAPPTAARRPPPVRPPTDVDLRRGRRHA